MRLVWLVCGDWPGDSADNDAFPITTWARKTGRSPKTQPSIIERTSPPFCGCVPTNLADSRIDSISAIFQTRSSLPSLRIVCARLNEESQVFCCKIVSRSRSLYPVSLWHSIILPWLHRPPRRQVISCGGRPAHLHKPYRAFLQGQS